MNVNGTVKDPAGTPASGLLVDFVGSVTRGWLVPPREDAPPGTHPRTGIASASTGRVSATVAGDGQFTIATGTPALHLPPNAHWNSAAEEYHATVTVRSPSGLALAEKHQTATTDSFHFDIQIPISPSMPSTRVVTGSGSGAVRPNTPHMGTELLSSFYFNYDHANDNHLQAIGITPDQPSPGMTTLIFQDESPDSADDRYFYNVAFLDSSYHDVYSTTCGREVSVGSGTRNLLRPPGDNVFVLRGFYIYYHGRDHHLEEISILEESGVLTVAFSDKNKDDTIIWEVNYAYVPRSIFRELGERSGRARGCHRDTITPGTAVLRGFHYKFLNGDHHIRDIGVWMAGDGLLDVYYEDHNGDDEFEYKVRWAVLPQTLAVYMRPSAMRLP